MIDNLHCTAKEAPLTPTLTRRGFLKAGAATGMTALIANAFPGGAWAAGSGGLEKTRLTLGIIPLTDCAPLVIAAEKGYFRKHGLDVQISKEASWANIRDKVALDQLDGGHMLAGMPIAATLGIGATRQETITAFSMDLNGNGITVSNELYERMVQADPEAMAERPVTARALRKVIDADRRAGKPPMTFAMVFPVSTHNYELRYWLASAGIDPENDVRLIVIPPPQMVANMQSRNIDGYCVGEPWNQRAVDMGIGHAIVTNYEIWNNNPEKVFGVTRAWADRHPNTHRAAVRALIEAAQWMDKPENRAEVVKIISARPYVNAPENVVANSMTGTWRYSHDAGPVSMPDFNVFYRYAATFPWRSHAVWFLTQMVRWGQIDVPIRFREVAEMVYRADIYREAAAELGVAVPTIDYKTEGNNDAPWTLADASEPIEMGPDRFFDGMSFDPDRPLEYLAAFPVKSMKVDLAALAAANA